MAEVEATWRATLRQIRAHLMALPSRIGSRAPTLTRGDIAAIEQEVRDALGEAAEAAGEAVPAP